MTSELLNDNVTLPGNVRAAATVVWREIGRTLVVRDIRSGATFHLTDSSARVWQSINQLADVQTVIDQLTAEYGSLDARDVTRDVVEFVSAALANGLLRADGGSQAPSVDRGPLQLGSAAVEKLDDLGGLRTTFERQHYLCLPQFVEPALLEEISRCAEAERFVPRTHDGIGTELYLAESPVSAALQLMFNDPNMLGVMTEITGCAPLRCFDGRIYRMLASEGHYDSWHSDAGKDRRVAVSVNLSREPYDGGLLEIRHASSHEAESIVPRMPFGGAVIFRISPDLRHRVTSVSGTRPRTAYAGWFCSTPDFQEQYFSLTEKR